MIYRAKVGPGAIRGDGTNRAQAFSAAPAMASNLARVKIELQDGAFSSRGVIVGKVFLDKNNNRLQDPGEDGIPGVRLFMEDGSYVVTDSEGKYSLAGITAQTHIVKLDRTTLPPHAKLEVIDNRNAGDPGSVMVGMNHAEMQKVNFAVTRDAGARGVCRQDPRCRGGERDRRDRRALKDGAQSPEPAQREYDRCARASLDRA